jgi:hypothetical protein
MTVGAGSNEDALYDAYLDAALRGELEEPEAYLDRNGAAGDALRDRLAAIHATFREAAPAGGYAPGTPEDDAASGGASVLSAESGLPFESLGEFRLLRPLGGGGMGMVFLAEQTSLERLVALKTIRPEHLTSPTAVRRFEREALALAQVSDRHVVGVHGFGEDHGVRFIAMEFVPGRSLSDVLADDVGLETTTAVRWARQLAGALQSIHDAGIIHRDVKPSNVRITPEGQAVLVDFGLARDVDGGATVTESFTGSPAYASPEQVQGAGELDGRTDVYSLGVTLYQCLSGEPPFQAPTMEAVFQRLLSEDPAPLRQRNRAVSADLETVVLKAMEKDTQRRYATAAELGADLDALLAFHPISARRPRGLERARRWARRNRGQAAALAAAALLLVVVSALLVGQRVLEDRDRRQAALQAVADARAMIDTWRHEKQSVAEVEATVAEMRRHLEYEYLSLEETARLVESEEAVDASRLQRERAFYAVLDLLTQAQRLDPDVPGVDAVSAELYVEKLNEASEQHDRTAAAFYEQQVAAHDPDGSVRAARLRRAAVELQALTPGAEVHMFRYHEQADVVPGGQHRMVPVPLEGPDPLLDPGTWCLRLARAVAPLEPDDLVVELAGWPIEGTVLVAEAPDVGDAGPRVLDRLVSVDGDPVLGDWDVDRCRRAVDGGRQRTFVFERREADGSLRTLELSSPSLTDLGVLALEPDDLAGRGGVSARVYRMGRLLELALPSGLVARTTAAPVALSDRTRVTVPESGVIPADPGGYLLVFRKPGFETARSPAYLAPGHSYPAGAHLVPAGTTPTGFVKLPDAYGGHTWSMEHEVTAEDYLVFLNDPETLAEIDASPVPTRHPRQGGEYALGSEWHRLNDGTWIMDPDWHPRWPVVGVTWHDAMAYADWITRKAREAELPYRFRLPYWHDRSLMASVATDQWDYAWGGRFRPHWSNTCFSKPRANLEPVLRYPIDETPALIYDLCGGAFEWLDDWFDEERRLRAAAGGAWGRSQAVVSKTSGGLGFEAEQSSGETGFRLILEIDGFEPAKRQGSDAHGSGRRGAR